MSESQQTLFLLTCDLFFTSRIEGAARGCGFALQTVASIDQLEQSLKDEGATVLIDLESPSLDFDRLSSTVRDHAARWIGYASHVKTHLFEKAESAGISILHSRGEISGRLPQILNHSD